MNGQHVTEATDTTLGALGRMKVMAENIDAGLEKVAVEISDVFQMYSSREEFIPQASELILGVQRDTELLRDVTEEMKNSFTHKAHTIKAENKKVDETLKMMEENLDRIENELEKHGYKRFHVSLSGSPIEDIVTESQSDSSTDEEEVETSTHTPMMTEEIDSSGYNEITPYVIKSGNLSKPGESSKKSMTVASYSENRPSSSASLNLFKRLTPTPTPSKSFVAKSPGTLLVKPSMPILSKYSYELLGTEPPAECSEKSPK